MNKEKHLEKAGRIESSIEKLDKEKDWELVVEGVYGAAQHYIAYISEQKLGKHQETHKGLIKFLRENNLEEISNLFMQIDELRIGRWYGGKINGETSKLAFEILNKIKQEAENERSKANK